MALSDPLLTYLSFSKTLKGYLPPSANVDMLLFSIGIKNGIRTKGPDDSVQERKIYRWGKQNELAIHADHEGYLFIAHDESTVSKLIELDIAYPKDPSAFGLLLGYPNCCCKKIAEIGEANIDAYEAQIIAQTFSKEYALIDPSGYRQGCSLISHVPCSTSCLCSLKQAKEALFFLLKNGDNSLLSPWLTKYRF